MIVLKDGKIIYNQSLNVLNGKQKLAGKLIAGKTGNDAADVLQDCKYPYKLQQMAGCRSCDDFCR